MDLTTIVAISGSTATIVGVMIALMFWMRQEANSLRSEAKEDRREIVQLVRSIELEMKDFHHRLIEVERGRRS